jgi:deoxyadenosine/deoxycytidine kinase
MKKEGLFIVIAGNIATGKTTLAKKLSETFDVEMHEEPVLENPFLDAFYKHLGLFKSNPKDKAIKKQLQKSAYALQEYYFLSRIIDLKKRDSTQKTIIQDRSIYEDNHVFTLNGYKTGMIRTKDYLKYQCLYTLLTTGLSSPNLLIYLHASIPTLQKRLEERGHSYEQELVHPENPYLGQLQDRYSAFIAHYHKGPKLTIDTEQYDFRTNKKDITTIAETVEKLLEKTK